MDFQFDLIAWVGKTAKIQDAYHNQLFKANNIDLTKEQWVLLRVLSQRNGVSQNEIACVSKRDKTSITRLVNTMEKKNLIARMPSENDKRVNLLYITKYGQNVLASGNPVVEKMLYELKKGLSEKEIQGAISVLQKIQENMKLTDGC